jgi:hypothetical protein
MSSISIDDVNKLLNAYPISNYLKEKLKPFIIKNWSTRNNGSGKQLSVDELIILLKGKCSQSQMKNIHTFEQQLKEMEKQKVSSEQIDMILDSKSKYYTDGVYGVLGEDVIWENGEVKDFKDKDDRYVECAQELADKAFKKLTGAKRRKKLRRKTKKGKRK